MLSNAVLSDIVPTEVWLASSGRKYKCMPQSVFASGLLICRH